MALAEILALTNFEAAGLSNAVRPALPERHGVHTQVITGEIGSGVAAALEKLLEGLSADAKDAKRNAPQLLVIPAEAYFGPQGDVSSRNQDAVAEIDAFVRKTGARLVLCHEYDPATVQLPDPSPSGVYFANVSSGNVNIDTELDAVFKAAFAASSVITAASAAAPTPRPKILLVEPDDAKREEIHAALAPEFDVEAVAAIRYDENKAGCSTPDALLFGPTVTTETVTGYLTHAEEYNARPPVVARCCEGDNIPVGQGYHVLTYPMADTVLWEAIHGFLQPALLQSATNTESPLPSSRKKSPSLLCVNFSTDLQNGPVTTALCNAGYHLNLHPSFQAAGKALTQNPDLSAVVVRVDSDTPVNAITDFINCVNQLNTPLPVVFFVPPDISLMDLPFSGDGKDFILVQESNNKPDMLAEELSRILVMKGKDCTAVEKQNTSAPPPQPAACEKNKRKILLIEDENHPLTELQMALEVEGYEVRVKHSGNDITDVLDTRRAPIGQTISPPYHAVIISQVIGNRSDAGTAAVNMLRVLPGVGKDTPAIILAPEGQVAVSIPANSTVVDVADALQKPKQVVAELLSLLDGQQQQTGISSPAL